MKVAVVGGGITGSVIASELARKNVAGFMDFKVVLFDQGRRGPGGRASHRSVEVRNDGGNIQFNVQPDDEVDPSCLHFDHGCQFFRADSAPMKDLVNKWIKNGWVAEWKARIGRLPQEKGNEERSTEDFFGVPSTKNDEDENRVYIGVGGMHQLPRRILGSCDAMVYRGARVSSVDRRYIDGKRTWDVTTTVGNAAFHDTDESDAKRQLHKASTTTVAAASDAVKIGGHRMDTSNDSNQTCATRIVVHCGFDAVIFTDISSSSASWHRASAGIPATFTSRLPSKVRLPLFSCMIALKTPIADQLPFDAFVAGDSSQCKDQPLWFAARSDSKPGFPKASEGCNSDSPPALQNFECWTLISTPSFAVDQIRETTMRDPLTGAFRPQENKYLNSVPGPKLKDAFFDLVRPYIELKTSEGTRGPKDSGVLSDENILYLQAQRWGSGLPIDPETIASPNDIQEICGTTYVSKLNRSLVYSSDKSQCELQNFVADDEQGLYYGGDFCSHLNPGFEAAALSGLELSQHILSLSGTERRTMGKHSTI